jgi:translation initiation factor 2B subunit (eIF-2B alpha/beta/delta family)
MATAEQERIRQLEEQLRDKEELLQGGVQYAARCGAVIKNLMDEKERADAHIQQLEQAVRIWKTAVQALVQSVQLVDEMEQEAKEHPPK